MKRCVVLAIASLLVISLPVIGSASGVPAAEGASRPAPRLAAFNDRSLGATERSLIEINELPCAKNGSDPMLFCMKNTHLTELATRRDLLCLVRDFSGLLKGWSTRQDAPAGRWSANLFTHLGAVVLDPYASGIELRIERGAGDPIASDRMALYLVLPSKAFELGALDQWVREQGREGWKDVGLAGIVQATSREFFDPRHRWTRAERKRRAELYLPGSIRARTLRPGDTGYAEALREHLRLEAALDPRKKAEMEAIRSACEQWASRDRANFSAFFVDCLRENHYTGFARYAVFDNTLEGEFVDGYQEGTWTRVLDEASGSRTEMDFRHGELQGAMRHFQRDSRGREYLHFEELPDRFEGNLRKSSYVQYYNTDGTRSELDFKDAERGVRVRTRYCADGVSIKSRETRDLESGEELLEENFTCP